MNCIQNKLTFYFFKCSYKTEKTFQKSSTCQYEKLTVESLAQKVQQMILNVKTKRNILIYMKVKK